MYFKDYSKPYKILDDAFIEVFSYKKNSKDHDRKIVMWMGDFDSILDSIPLSEDGMFVGLAYHHHVDFAWQECSPIPWEMDQLKVSLSQIQYIKENNLVEEDLLSICEDIYITLEEAYSNEGKVFIRYFY